MFTGIANYFSSPDVAVDLGTANTRLFAAGRGILAEVPTKIRARNRSSRGAGNPLLDAAGQSDPVTPLRGGAVVDVGAAAQLLRRLLKRASPFGFIRSRILVCAPTCLSEYERTNLISAVKRTGARAVAIVPSQLAAAIGAGLEVCSPYAQMIVDIGDGVTDIAIVREGNLIQTAATRVAGSDLHKAVQRMAAKRYRIRLTEKAAEFLTLKLGSVSAPAPFDSFEICGVTADGRKITLTIESREIAEAIKPIASLIVATISRAVREMPPEAGAEIVETGICLTGGVSLLPGIADRIVEKTDLPVFFAPSPLHSVIEGAGMMLDVSAKTNLWQR